MNQKTIFITGASRGIGKSIALLFASRGYHTFLNCSTSMEELRRVKQEIKEKYHTPCTLVPGNVGDSRKVNEIYERIYEECTHLDVLVNNAGISYINLLTDMTDEDWNRIIQTNLSSAFYCCRQAIPPMVSKRSGKIINISSMWGTSGASCEVAYSASKSGINGFTKALAKELAPSNVQVNAIACGVIDTSMNNQLTAEERKALEEDIPAGRYGTPEEIAQMVWNIVHAPDYMTGQIIGVDGGFL